jgi:RNA polymerase sigma-70 factor (ECF subfamily)
MEHEPNRSLREMSDEELVQHWQKYRVYEVFDILYERYERRFFHFFYFKTNRLDDAEDLLHEISLKILTKLDSFQAKSSLQNWLFKIASNLLNDFWKKQKREEEQRDLFHTPELQEPQISDFLEVEKLQKCLEKLSQREKEILFFKEVEQKTYREIGELSSYEFSPQNAQKIHKVAKDKLVKCLQKEWTH